MRSRMMELSDIWIMIQGVSYLPDREVKARFLVISMAPLSPESVKRLISLILSLWEVKAPERSS